MPKRAVQNSRDLRPRSSCVEVTSERAIGKTGEGGVRESLLPYRSLKDVGVCDVMGSIA